MVRETSVAVDHLIYPARFANTYVTVDFDEHPATLWETLSPPDYAKDHSPYVLHGGTVQVLFPTRGTGGGGGPVHVYADPLVVGRPERGVRLIYEIWWVGTGTLVDDFFVDGKRIQVRVPFDDHRNVPRPADMTTPRW